MLCSEISSCISQSTKDLAATGPLKPELGAPRYKGHADYGILPTPCMT